MAQMGDREDRLNPKNPYFGSKDQKATKNLIKSGRDTSKYEHEFTGDKYTGRWVKRAGGTTRTRLQKLRPKSKIASRKY
jgi:hypothetical protein